MYVVERPMVQGDWFEFGLVRAQAKTKIRWQVACLTFAALFFASLIAASVAVVWLWADRTASAQRLAETQDLLTNSGEQIAALQAQLMEERRDHAEKLEAEKTRFEGRANALAIAEAQITRAVGQFKILQAQLTAERESHEAKPKSQQASHAATVDRLHAGISELAAHVVELSKALTELQPTP